MREFSYEPTYVLFWHFISWLLLYSLLMGWKSQRSAKHWYSTVKMFHRRMTRWLVKTGLWNYQSPGMPASLDKIMFFVRKFTNCRRKFRSETSDNMDSWKAEVRRVRRDKIRRKKMQMREKVGNSRFTVFFQWFVAPEGRKVGSLKRRVRSQLARWDMKKWTPLWREAHFQVKMDKTLEDRTTFGSCDVEKVHAVVARSTFGSQNVQNTPWSDHFWKLRCWKSARRCGAKHISKSKCTKHRNLGPLLEVEMLKKCTPLWREAHFQVKMLKTLGVRTTFGGSDVEKVSKKCTPLWREAHFEVKSVKNWGFWAFFDVKMSKK